MCEQIDMTPLEFGKYKGDTPAEIAQHDPGYIIWIYENMDDPPCSEELYDACVGDAVEDLISRMGRVG